MIDKYFYSLIGEILLEYHNLSDIDILSTPIFEFSSGKAVVLTKHEDNYQLRYNEENITMRPNTL